MSQILSLLLWKENKAKGNKGRNREIISIVRIMAEVTHILDLLLQDVILVTNPLVSIFDTRSK